MFKMTNTPITHWIKSKNSYIDIRAYSAFKLEEYKDWDIANDKSMYRIVGYCVNHTTIHVLITNIPTLKDAEQLLDDLIVEVESETTE